MSTYDVILLVEQPLSTLDAEQVRGLHAEVEDPVKYHLLLPADDAATRVETAIGTMSGGEFLAPSAPLLDPEDLREIQKDLTDKAQADVGDSVQRLLAAGGDATGRVVNDDPIDALVETAKEVGAAEVIILTRPHIVAEFFHLDWTSRARRKLGVPVLHLLEHENFDEQAGGGEGISGF